MSASLSDHRLLMALTSTEWRNLCERGDIRLLGDRAVRVATSPSQTDLDRVFTLAPMTKLGSSVDTFVLEIRPDWPASSSPHRHHGAVFRLSVGDVLSHHVVSADDATYYSPQAERAGVLLSGQTYEREWREWTAGEIADSTIVAAVGLAGSYGLTLTDSGVAWWPLAMAVTSGRFDQSGLDPRLRHFLAHSSSIDDTAGSARGTHAFGLAVAIEWVEACTGVHPLDELSIDAIVLEPALAESRSVGWLERRPVCTAAALDMLQLRHPAAFDDLLSADGVGSLVRLLVEARYTTPNAGDIDAIVTGLVETWPRAAACACLFAAAAIGPELCRQMVRWKAGHQIDHG